MKTKSLNIISALAIGVFALGTTLYAQQGSHATDTRIGSIRHDKSDKAAAEAKAITKAEAEKKYPIKGGAYPTGDRDTHDPAGIIRSPYPPNEKYDCSKIAHGGLVLDTKANKVFVRP